MMMFVFLASLSLSSSLVTYSSILWSTASLVCLFFTSSSSFLSSAMSLSTLLISLIALVDTVSASFTLVSRATTVLSSLAELARQLSQFQHTPPKLYGSARIRNSSSDMSWHSVCTQNWQVWHCTLLWSFVTGRLHRRQGCFGLGALVVFLALFCVPVWLPDGMLSIFSYLLLLLYFFVFLWVFLLLFCVFCVFFVCFLLTLAGLGRAQ